MLILFAGKVAKMMLVKVKSFKNILNKVFKSGLSKFFKGCLPQDLLSLLLNTLPHILVVVIY